MAIINNNEVDGVVKKLASAKIKMPRRVEEKLEEVIEEAVETEEPEEYEESDDEVKETLSDYLEPEEIKDLWSYSSIENSLLHIKVGNDSFNPADIEEMMDVVEAKFKELQEESGIRFYYLVTPYCVEIQKF